MKRRKYIIPTVCLLGLSSCTKDLDIEYHDIEPLTVIEAELNPDGIRVRIGLTTPMDEPMDRTLLTDASVVLSDITTGEEFVLATDSDGSFYNDIPGISGHDYRLRIERNGKIYEAETTMFPPTEFVSLDFNWIKMPYDYVAVLQTRFLDCSDGDDYFWIKIYRNGKIYKWSELSDSGSVNGQLTFVTMTSRKDTDEEDDDEVLYDGDVVTVSVSGISREMNGYLEAIGNDSNGPAMFTGDKCLGYFLATSPVSKTIVFHPDEIPEYK